MVSFVLWYAALGIVQAVLAAWVILAQPRRMLNWAVGALLLLWAGSGVMFQLMRESVDPATFSVYSRTGSYYEAPTFLLVLLVIDHFSSRRPRPLPWVLALTTAAATVVLFWVGNAQGLFLGSARRVDSTVIEIWSSATLPNVNAFLNIAAQAAAVVVASRAATDAHRPLLHRRQAALVGLAFALLVAQPAGGSVYHVLDRGLALHVAQLPTVAMLLAAGAVIYALPRLLIPFRPGARWVMVLVPLLALGLGVANVGMRSIFTRYGIRVVILSAFALLLAVAILRYDLAGSGFHERRRLQATAGVTLGLAVGVILAGAAWSLTGQAALTVGSALLAMLLPVALLATPLRVVPEWVTRRVLFPPRHPDALRDRVHVYGVALQAALTQDGRLPPEMEPDLAKLRAQLGLSRRDHELLLAQGPRSPAAGLVAYRLALDEAAEAGADLQRLRNAWGVTEKDHEMVLAALSPAAAPDRLFLGRYRIMRALGEGASGKVWLARDEREGRDVVLKRLTEGEQRDARAFLRAQREARTATALRHPHIVDVHAVEAVGDAAYLVMEHVQGGTLADALRTRGPLPEAEVVRIGLDVLSALAALHERGILHRDVKPANILLDGQGRAKLGDFTIAREIVSGDTLGEGPQRPVGTFAYMPPEQARGLQARPASDLYAVGATLYEAVSGQPPLDLDGLSHAEAATRVSREAPRFPAPGASPGLDAVLVRALSKRMEDRYEDASSMAAALADVLHPTPAGTPAGSAPPRGRPPAGAAHPPGRRGAS